REALFTLGDKPELRYRVARDELAALGCSTTLEYLARCARLVLDETGLLPHVNPGVLSLDDTLALREVSASQGRILETTAARLARSRRSKSCCGRVRPRGSCSARTGTSRRRRT